MENRQDWHESEAVFLDADALEAFMDPADERYEQARFVFMRMDRQNERFVTTSYVVEEVYRRLKRDGGDAKANYFLQVIEEACNGGWLLVISGNEQLEREAKLLIEQCPDVPFTLQEAMTSVVLLSYGIKRIFTFNSRYAALHRFDEALERIPS